MYLRENKTKTYKTKAMQNYRGQTRCIVADVELANVVEFWLCLNLLFNAHNYLGDVPHKRTIFAINLYRLDNPSTGNNLWGKERENLDDEKMLSNCVLVQFYPCWLIFLLEPFTWIALFQDKGSKIGTRLEQTKFATLETTRELEPKCVPQLFPGSLTGPEVIAKDHSV